jgi:hypothetical protein
VSVYNVWISEVWLLFIIQCELHYKTMEDLEDMNPEVGQAEEFRKSFSGSLFET